MHPLALWSEEHEQLDWLRVRAAEPVRGVGVELRGLAGAQLEVELGEPQPEPAVEHVHPFIALVRALLGGPGPWLDDHLVRLHATGAPGKRIHRAAVPAHGGRAQPRILRCRAMDELIDGHLVRAGQPQQQFERGTALPGLQP